MIRMLYTQSDMAIEALYFYPFRVSSSMLAFEATIVCAVEFFALARGE